MSWYLFGFICGLIIGFFIPKERTIYHIKKLKTKGNNSHISVNTPKKKRKLFNKFKRNKS